MEEVLKDDRFAKIAKDPRFRRMPKEERKVKIDKRFKSMFSDKRFKLKYMVDKRGRPVNTTTNENLRRYYELSDEDDDTSDDENEDKNVGEESNESDELDNVKEIESSTQRRKPAFPSSGGSTIETKTGRLGKSLSEEKTKLKKKKKSDDGVESKSTIIREHDEQKITKAGKNKSRLKPHVSDSDEDTDAQETENDDLKEQKLDSGVGSGADLARGEGNLESSSDESEESDDEEEEEQGEEEFDHKWGELDKTVAATTDLGRRLAVCNMDWDRIKAPDIFVLLSSFKPTGGIIYSVKIYPSEFGLQRMQEEAVKGPHEVVETTSVTRDLDPDKVDKEGDSYHQEKLRQYQINRLKYYYAVVECDTEDTANKIYEECDGIEYENSATKMDLRFIPDDMTFDAEPTSVCTEVLDNAVYKPSNFFTTALCQSKVDLTWDETDPDRTSVTMRKFNKKDIKEDDFQAYLASSSDDEGVDYGDLVENNSDQEDGEESENEEEQIEKYKRLVQDIRDSDKNKGKKDMGLEITWEPGLKETTEDILKKKRETKDLTVWEEYLHKKKEKKKQKREQKEKKSETKVESHNAKKKVKNLAVEQEDRSEDQAFSDDDLPVDVDLSDPYFAEEMESVDKKSTGIEKKKKKGKKKHLNKGSTEETEEERHKKAELSLLMMDPDDDKNHFNLKDIMEADAKDKKKKKRKKKKNVAETAVAKDNFTMNVKDPRFSDMYESHLFNIDPSAPEYKKTKGMEAVIQEKFRRRQELKSHSGQAERTSEKTQKRKHKDSSDIISKKVRTGSGDNHDVTRKASSVHDPALASLLHSVKNKTQKHHWKQKK